MTLLFRGHIMQCFIQQKRLLKKEMTFSSHKAVISTFGQYFVRTGIFDKLMGRYLNIIFGERQLGDYDSNLSISEDSACQTLKSAQVLVDQVVEWPESDLSDD